MTEESTKPMIADLHCHYPMHLLEKEPPQHLTWKAMVQAKDRRWLDKLRALALAVAARFLNFRHPWDGWRVSLKRLQDGDVRLVFSVLFVPDTEMDTDAWPHGPPADRYFKELTERLDQVNGSLPAGGAATPGPLIIKSQKDLKDVVDGKRLGITHCVEGGFHLGGTISKIDGRVRDLADRGVAYITLAHLFWRQVATNAPAIPFFSDRLYARLFPQPESPGLTPLGREAVRAMYEHGVLIDISHMRQDAIDETFALLRDLDKKHEAKPEDFPVIATHAGWRFGKQAYMLNPETVKGIKERDGVIGLIMARHQLNDGLPDPKSNDPAHTVQIMRRHIDEIHGLVHSHRHVGIGSDLDGFIKPTMAGIEYADDLQSLVGPLQKAYPTDADAILWRNAARVLDRALAKRGAGPPP